MITDTQILQRFKENHLRFTHLPLQNGAFILVGERGGRVFGPFFGEGEPSLYWVNPIFGDPTGFAQALRDGFWNQGGERVWIAPEIQYFVHDRCDFWGTNQLPHQMDPGQFRLSPLASGEISLVNQCNLRAYNLASGEKSLSLDVRLRSVENPLRALPDFAALMSGVNYAGYEQKVTLVETNAAPIRSESWNLIQLNPGGTLIIPASPRVVYHDYFEPVDAAHQQIHAHHVQLQITGQRRYKTGYMAAHLTGRAAYYNTLAGDRAYLLVRHFFNNPSAPYIEEPAHLPGAGGKSLHVYNDGGMFGGFGELEVNGQTIGNATGHSSSTDAFVMWAFIGAPAALQEIAGHLLGVVPVPALGA